jgi:tRNA nucleotidyltransferase (CCA-adding enzyme)
MMQNNVLNELPKERIFEEIKKLLLKSTQPSLGFKLLKELSGFTFFTEFQTLREEEFKAILNALDRVVSIAHASNEKEKITLMLAILTSKFSKEQRDSFLEKLTNQKEIYKNVEKLTNISFQLTNQSNYDIYKLATQTEIAFFALYLLALYPDKKQKITKLITTAKRLGVYHNALPPLIEGKDLIQAGLKPSKDFSKILNDIYEKELREEITTKEEALNYLNRTFVLS